jgi:predicted transcriptional regulator/predicted RNA-binding Zn-ribbon protein involved in translation (DUF1610 family)
MSKITFRADDELVDALESFDESKSEVMRKALRQYLESHPEADINLDSKSGVNASKTAENTGDSIDEMIVERIDELLEERLGPRRPPRKQPEPARDVNVNITLDGDSAVTTESSEAGRKTEQEPVESASDNTGSACTQCGENVSTDHVYCPNCGEKASHRSFCDCGTELGSDWAFCPGCGRRTPAADVLDR